MYYKKINDDFGSEERGNDIKNDSSNNEQANMDQSMDKLDCFNIPICDDSEKSALGFNRSADQVAKEFLKKICFLFYYNVEKIDEFCVVDNLGQFLDVDTAPKNNFLEEKKC